MEKTRADKCSSESLDIGKNSYDSKPLTYRRTRAIEEIEEEERLEKIAKNVGLTEGENMKEGIPEKEMMELSKYDDPISVWISRKKTQISRKKLIETDEKAFYCE